MDDGGSIQIRIGGVELTTRGDVDPAQWERVLTALKTHLPECLGTEPVEPAPPRLRDLLDRSDARTFGDKAGIVAYWLEVHRGRSSWRTGDVLDALRDAGEPEPANLTDALNQKARKGLLEVKDRRWRLTGQGLGWVRFGLLHERDDDEDPQAD